jgi:arabinofuranan 3-O-arabinosyltransferase
LFGDQKVAANGRVSAPRTVVPVKLVRIADMINAVESRRKEADLDRQPSRPVDIFNSQWLQSFGYAFAALYLLYFVILYRAGTWIVGGTGLPIYTDFAAWWAAGMQALHGDPAALYNPEEFAKIQSAVFGRGEAFYPNWPSYPPTFFLVLAPLALLPYCFAFITWDVVTLLGCVAVVYLIVRRRAAIALTLAAPFSAWNFLAAQNGFLTASLLGGSLLFLERRPVLAGVFIGCLTYKPQYGILFPVALLASRQWCAIASTAVTAAVLVAASVVLFGAEVWAVFPHGFAVQSQLSLGADPDSNWGYLQTAYGLIRSLHGSGHLAWLVQGLVTLGGATTVWIIWRSRLCYELKAAILSAAALLATPYAFAYDMAGIVIPAAFLATDQLSRGLLQGEKTVWIILFGAPLAVLATLGDNAGGTTFGGTPICLFAAMMLFCVILRRALRWFGKPNITDGDLGLEPATFR